MIITIGRQVGSGGRLIGKILAQRLGLKFYDREILERAAKESGIRDEFFEQSDERNTLLNRFARFFMADHLLPINDCLSTDSLFKYQSDVIRKAATEGNGAVFVGRCSDYILRDMDCRLDVFITASLDKRISRASKYFEVSETETEKKIAEMEKARAEYYNFFTDKTWGAAESYHLCVDSTEISIEQAAELIISYAKMRGMMA